MAALLGGTISDASANMHCQAKQFQWKNLPQYDYLPCKASHPAVQGNGFTSYGMICNAR